MHSRTNAVAFVASSCWCQQSSCEGGKDIALEVELGIRADL